MKKILITGSSGLLASAIIHKFKNKFDLYLTSRNPGENFDTKFKSFDLSCDDYSLLTNWTKPDIIIHCAASTNVDQCEVNKNEALKVNTETVKKLKDVFPESKFVFISTDAVFSEPNGCVEESECNPVNYYGHTKYLAEQYLRTLDENFLIIRTTIVGLGGHRQSFCDWILNSAKNGKEIGLFTDSFFNPISIWNFSEKIDWCLDNDVQGIFHINGSEIISKYDFGIKLVKAAGLRGDIIKKIKISDMNFIAKRNSNMSLSVEKFKKIYNAPLPDINTTITEICLRYGEQYERD